MAYDDENPIDNIFEMTQQFTSLVVGRTPQQLVEEMSWNKIN